MSKVYQGRTSLPRTRRHPVARSLAMALGLAAPHAAWAACGPNPITINSDQTLGATNVAACDYYDWTAGNVTVTGAVSGAVTDPPPYSLLSKTGMTAATLVIEATGSVVNSDDAAVTVGNSTGVASALTALTNGGVVQTTSPMGWNAIFIWNNAALGTLTNEAGGQILGGVQGTVQLWNNASIGTLDNRGEISTGNAGASAIRTTATSTIDTLINTGTLSAGAGGYDIVNAGDIGTLENGQGGNDALSYSGNLPDRYITHFSDASTYGKVEFALLGGYTLNTYGARMAAGQNWAAGTYNDVIVSDQALTITSLEAISGISYQLVSPDNGLTWNLVVQTASASRVADAVGTQGGGPSLDAARVIDGNAGLSALFANLTTNGQLADAAAQSLPLMQGSTTLAAQGAMGSINRIIQARIEGNAGMSSGDDFLGDRHFWFKPFGSRADQGDRKGASGFDADTMGIALGADATVTPNTRVGLSFAYARVDLKGTDAAAPNSADLDVYQLTGYGSHSLDERTELNFQLGVGQNRNEGRRNILFAGSTARSQYDSLTAVAGLGVGRSFPLSAQTRFTPSVRADYAWIKDQSYSESGAGLLDLKVDGNTTEALVLAVDGKLAHALDAHATAVANLGVGYDLLNERNSLTATFAGAPGASFTTRGIDPSPWLLRAGLGYVRAMKNGMEITARYDGEYREDFLVQTASVKLRLPF